MLCHKKQSSKENPSKEKPSKEETSKEEKMTLDSVRQEEVISFLKDLFLSI